MIEYRFAAPELSELDRLESDILVLPLFEDERPLRGVAGLIDWRLCGALSRKLADGTASAGSGEQSWIIAPPKLSTKRLLLLGLGPSPNFDQDLAKTACRHAALALTGQTPRAAAIALPGRSLDRIAPADAMRAWLDATATSLDLVEVVIIEETAHHKPLLAVVDSLRRQAESPIG